MSCNKIINTKYLHKYLIFFKFSFYHGAIKQLMSFERNVLNLVKEVTKQCQCGHIKMRDVIKNYISTVKRDVNNSTTVLKGSFPWVKSAVTFLQHRKLTEHGSLIDTNTSKPASKRKQKKLW